MAKHHPSISFDGDRILLRDSVLDDLPAVHAVANNPEVHRFQPWGSSSIEDTGKFVRSVIQAAEQHPRTDYTLAIVLRQTGRLIGYGSLWLENDRFRHGEIGYFLHPDYWGQGLWTESARLLLRIGFAHVHLHRISATCDPRNVASQRVLQKVGMTHEGHLRQTMLIHDGWRDSDVYGILC